MKLILQNRKRIKKKCDDFHVRGTGGCTKWTKMGFDQKSLKCGEFYDFLNFFHQKLKPPRSGRVYCKMVHFSDQLCRSP